MSDQITETAEDIQGDLQLKPDIDSLFKENPGSFSIQILNLWSNALGQEQFEIIPTAKTNIPTQVKRENLPDGTNKIRFYGNPTLDNLLEAAALIDLNKSVESSPLQQFAHNLRDAAILLTKQKVFEKEEFNLPIESIYRLSSIIQAKLENVNVPPAWKKYLEIKQENITPPDRINSQDYENHLFLFLLGKNFFLRKDDQSSNILPTFYESFYTRWKNKQLGESVAFQDTVINGTLIDTDKLQQNFDSWLISHKKLISSLLAESLRRGFLPGGKSLTSLLDINEQKTEQHLDYVLTNQGRKMVEDTLTLPPTFRDMDPFLWKNLERIFGPDLQIQPLFTAADKILAKLERDLGDKLTTGEKIIHLWDLVQAYKFKITYLPLKAVQTKEFECNLRVFILGQLYEKFMNNELVVLGDAVPGHTRLIVLEKKVGSDEINQGYFVEPSASRFYYDEVGTRLFNRSEDQSVQPILDHNFFDRLVQAYHQNPKSVTLQLVLNQDQENGKLGPYHNIGNYRNISEGGLWMNLGALVQTKEEAFNCFKKALEIEPHCASHWYNLGLTLSDNSERKKYFIKSLELNPELALGWNGLGEVAEEKELKKRYFRIANTLDPEIAAPLYNLAAVEDNPPKALELFILATETDPDNSQAWFHLGMFFKMCHEELDFKKYGYDIPEVIKIWNKFFSMDKIPKWEYKDNDLKSAQEELLRLKNLNISQETTPLDSTASLVRINKE